MNKIFKDILLITVIFIMVFILLVFFILGCNKTKIPVDSAPNTEAVVPDSAISENQDTETQDTGCTDEELETTVTESTEGELGQDKKEILVFKGNKVNNNTAVMIIEVNIITGELTGVLQMGFQSFDMNMGTTVVCDYVLTGSINGKLDLDTSKITGILTGEAKTGTLAEGCNNYSVNYEMIADIFENSSRIKGYFDTQSMDDYEFFLNLIPE